MPIERVERLVTRYPHAEKRLFTASERAYCRGRRRSFEHLSARVAAKEAVGKAFGTGIGRGISWRDVEVLVESSGRPSIRLHAEAERWAERWSLEQLDISLSHTGDLAVAYVVALVGARRPLEP